jgi:glycosyltransferase involved in cell wall biosynthesis
MIDDLPLGRPPTHILHVSQPVDGGTAVVVEQLAAADLDHGRTVTIASPPGRLGEWASGRGVHWVELPLTRQPGRADLSAIAALRRLLPAAHVAYLHSSKAGAVGRMALAATPRDRRPKCVFIPHAWSWYVGGRAAPVYRQFERLASHWADAIVVLSTTEATDGRTVLPPTATHRVVQIHNGVDTAAYSTAGPVSDRAPGPLVVCVGRLSEQKGQDALIGALGLLADPDVMLRLIGDGPDASRLRALSRELGLVDRVEFVGSTDPRPHYRAADVVALPSRWEGQSLVLLEAMACGSAVLATPAAASGFGTSEGVLGTGGHDPEQLAGPLELLLGDAELRQQLGRAARAFVTEHHAAEITARRHDELVASLLTGPPRHLRNGPVGSDPGRTRNIDRPSPTGGGLSEDAHQQEKEQVTWQ